VARAKPEAAMSLFVVISIAYFSEFSVCSFDLAQDGVCGHLNLLFLRKNRPKAMVALNKNKKV